MSVAILYLICRQIHCEEVCLLLHVLLVESTYFRTYVLSRTDPETLVSGLGTTRPLCYHRMHNPDFNTSCLSSG
ncbi:hypothetical protein BCR41DRAFT_353001 [Lobosporangium transversale]|uniref:Uncharacterized protein n=1 Tax=Lobosporangium transversale TaxID=64571 RepID=A0A1Y2GNF4_9FUNG|nr:hypothetical protein BCR41DRAFT_353001 [Lobosporangium transversale]ORZ16713.1 hypothetical protein BCR41DRAFT_353001 [Lobosporangium transversale]|eukprot:XP_021881648.1 hypothetical protein BCR41DRAFT_353001 [Lobosporangium transversale]